jgi:glycosidase
MDMFTRSSHAFLSQATIYEVNLRQYSTEGNIRAFMSHLPRLKDMGVDVIWLMPIHPIGKINRKGSLGSYYSISDYQEINPEYGNLEDFKALVSLVHDLGMKIIIDWVANHAAWDNVWTQENPSFFCRDASGQFQSPYDWSDVIQIDHSNPDAHQALIDAMCFWVDNYDIDGFRADLAHLTPLHYWKNARTQTEKIKPGLIWLAETEESSYYDAFDVVYAWKWMHASEDYVKKGKNLESLINDLKIQNEPYPKDLFQLYFTSNHDENSWNGTEYEKYEKFAEAFAVFSFFYASSVPLIYSGQEIPVRKRIAFFDKDNLDWDRTEKQLFYKTLCTSRKKVCSSAQFQFLETKGKILAMKRGVDKNHVLVFMNLGNAVEVYQYDLPEPLIYRDIMLDETYAESISLSLKLNPGEFLVLENA